MPLANVGEEDGALEVAPGAWKGPLPHESDGGPIAIPESRLAGEKPVAVPVRRGDVLILDRFVPHRSKPVLSGKARWAFVMWVKAKSPPELAQNPA